MKSEYAANQEIRGVRMSRRVEPSHGNGVGKAIYAAAAILAAAILLAFIL